MRIRRPTSKRKIRKAKVTVDPSRLAVAALSRIEGVLTRTGHPERYGPGSTMRELAARASVAGRPLPPSYVAAMRSCTAIGEPDAFLDAAEMQATTRERLTAATRDRYLPFARNSSGQTFCFDLKSARQDGELSVVEWSEGIAKPVAAHFGEWLDGVADAREESVERAAAIPKGLRDLLLQLGFRFDDPIVGHLVTGDVPAIEALLGERRAREVRGDVRRVFDASGKAQLTLNLDEFTLTATLRTGTHTFEAEEVFRWLRYFRDENFYGETYRDPSHPDQVRDLRKAPREPPLVVRGVLEVSALPAKKHFFCAASGSSPQDFHLLGRGAGSDRATSLILHVSKGEVRSAHTLEQPLHHVHATEDGVVWGLSNYGAVVRFSAGMVDSFPLPRAAGALTWWYGIGQAAGRVVVWGTGALLQFDGRGFVPFTPDAALERHEAVMALSATRDEIAMLVCGEHVGAVARFDGRAWLPIEESHVLEADLADLDVWRGVGILLGRAGEVWRIEDGAPRPVIWDNGEVAFVGVDGQARPCHGVKGFDGGALIASDGGVIVVAGGEPTFHGARGAVEPVRLTRVGREAPASAGPIPVHASGGSPAPAVGVVATFGPHVWVWTGQSFSVLDLRAW